MPKMKSIYELNIISLFPRNIPADSLPFVVLTEYVAEDFLAF